MHVFVSVSIMETSNFAHVIFQDVGKSFLPQAPLECRYTLTPYITPHPKDWVGIFKTRNELLKYTFSDGEFYQFCYVTHTGDIRGASTPFQFRSATPTEELLTVAEDDSSSDILVVTTKTGLLERVEEAQQERRELLKAMRLLQEEKQQLQEEQKQLVREREQERETCCLLRTHNQELLRSSQGLSEEREDIRRKLTEAKDRIRQLEEDLLGVTQRGLQKETELDCLRDRLKKLTAERDGLESQLKNEKDERDLYKAHLRSTELENTKLSAELQMLKAVELNREVTIAQFQEELDSVFYLSWLHKHNPVQAELGRVHEQLRQTEEQLQASRQQACLLASELRDSTSTRDHTMSELYHARVEADELRVSLADAQAECRRMESQLDRMRSTSHKEVAPSVVVVSEAEAELQREVEELKLRLHMAAEHYKEKYRECQRLRRQVAKLNTADSQAVSTDWVEVGTERLSAGENSEAETRQTAERVSDGVEEEERQMTLEGEGRSTKEAETEQTRSVEAELATMEEKWREQCAFNETLKQQLAGEEERLRVRRSQISRMDAVFLQELQRFLFRQREMEAHGAEVRQPMLLRYPLPYPQNPSPPPLVPQRPAELQYGNPYSTEAPRDRVDVTLSPDQISHPSSEASPGPGAPGWAREVVCIQPARSSSPPENIEHPPEAQKSLTGSSPLPFSPSSSDIHKRCPLCEVIFPPHFEQRSFEQHVESHWKVCPVCSEQFPLNCQQQLFERHVLTHFDGHVLNFEQME
uniref:Tax1 (human T-cell leukemia virus type I) binding protein 1a n=1 Tax=Nothobranchius furzeri TaxID=105023 RepID=A0A8C6KXJ1_NOTFU